MPDYTYYRNALRGMKLPAAFVDLDLLDQNIHQILQQAGELPIRVASKSVRCCHLLRYISSASKQFCGLMTFSIEEALFLAEQGFDDLLMGYPETHPERLADLIQENRRGATILPMVDCEKHLELLNTQAIKQQFVQPICVDVDMSSQFPLVYFGTYRSSINSVARFEDFLRSLKRYPGLRLAGIMGYEAQIAGVGEANPFRGRLMNFVVRQLKSRSIAELTRRRQQCHRLAVEAGHQLRLVNGGGTGSIGSTRQDNSVTEVTVGSGFYCPGLFDYYRDFHFHPAAGFALEITRHPREDMFTLAGGGYVASGSVNLDKRPVPYLPKGIELVANEGTGEVQTPIKYSGQESLGIGEPVLFRHAKAGELCERFNELHLIRSGQIVQSVPTYRGQGRCFL